MKRTYVKMLRKLNQEVILAKLLEKDAEIISNNEVIIMKKYQKNGAKKHVATKLE